MRQDHRKGGYTHGSAAVTGVLVSNLGTPDAPDAPALRRYLGEFLWDPRVVEIPRLLWWLILHGVILRTRPRRSAEAYRRIWTEEGSPLLAISRAQAAGLQQRLEQSFTGPVVVAMGMRYGTPSLGSALAQLRRAGARRILLLPLYPQYSAATTASTFDAVASELKHWRWIPELRMVSHYHDEPAYIAALVTSIREYWANHGQPERLLFSFHGMPKRTHLAGDPYFCECQKTARLVAEQLQLTAEQWMITFQSRFGREEWLKPYTDQTLRHWGKAGLSSVHVVCPGFSADCLETLEEINMLNREIFHQAGGGDYHYIPALNQRVDHIEMLAGLVMKHTQGWPEASPDWNATQQTLANDESRRRALEMGASQ